MRARLAIALALAALAAGCALGPAPRPTAPPPVSLPLPELAAFSAQLNGREAVPANDSPAHGELLGDTRSRLVGAYVWSLSHGNAAGAGKPE